MADIEVRISGLSLLDIEAIKARAPEQGFEVETPAGNPRQANELMTLAVIGGIGLVSAAAGYFFGKRKLKVVDLDIEVRRADDTFLRVKLHILEESNEPVETQIMSQIKAALKG